MAINPNSAKYRRFDLKKAEYAKHIAGRAQSLVWIYLSEKKSRERRMEHSKFQSYVRAINETIKAGDKEGNKLAYQIISDVATDLLMPKFGVSDYKLITGKDKIDNLAEFGGVLENEIKTRYGLSLPLYVENFINMQINSAIAERYEMFNLFHGKEPSARAVSAETGHVFNS